MIYSTEQDLIDRFGGQELLQISDRTNLGTIDSAVVARAIADAGAVIDAHLSARYSLPLATVVPVLTRIGCDLARWYLYADAATDQVGRNYDEAMKLLASLRSGEITLGFEPAGGVAHKAPDRVFNADTLSVY